MPLTNVVCERCGLVYVNPRMGEAELRQFYTDRYREEFFAAGKPTERVARSGLRKAENWYAFIAPNVDHADRVLDIGCATGALLHLLKTRVGCEVSGVEPTTAYADYARESYGLDVACGMFPEADLPCPTYDVVILCHVLEHMADPLSTLRAVAKVLSPTGRLFVSVPSILGVHCRLGYFLQHSHLFNFTPASLAHMLFEAGFEVQESGVDKGYSAFHGINVMARRPINGEPVAIPLAQDWRAVASYCRRHRFKYALYRWFPDFPRNVRKWLKRQVRAAVGRKLSNQ